MKVFGDSLGGYDKGKGGERTICKRVQKKAEACVEMKID